MCISSTGDREGQRLSAQWGFSRRVWLPVCQTEGALSQGGNQDFGLPGRGGTRSFRWLSSCLGNCQLKSDEVSRESGENLLSSSNVLILSCF